ncbi:MAG TPA: HAD family phosphatase [Polyangia bacterium]|jgi:HAD superfamily hydrolase (TIGR01509 family)
MLRAVLFDLDGTLIDSERQNAESVGRVLAARGRPLSDEEREFVIGHGWAEIYRHLHAAGGVDLSYDELKHLAAVEREKIVAKEGLDILPGAVHAVERLSARFDSTVVSGSSRAEIALILRVLGVGIHFPWFIGAEDTERGKPAPDGYLLASDRLGIAPAECLVLEDSTAGIRAGRAAGMRVVAVRAGNFAAQPQDEADRVVDTLEDVDDRLLAELFGPAYIEGESSS